MVKEFTYAPEERGDAESGGEDENGQEEFAGGILGVRRDVAEPRELDQWLIEPANDAVVAEKFGDVQLRNEGEPEEGCCPNSGAE